MPPRLLGPALFGRLISSSNAVRQYVAVRPQEMELQPECAPRKLQVSTGIAKPLLRSSRERPRRRPGKPRDELPPLRAAAYRGRGCMGTAAFGLVAKFFQHLF